MKILILFLTFFISTLLSAAEKNQQDVSKEISETHPIRVCVGPLGEVNESGSRTHPKEWSAGAKLECNSLKKI